ncbi:MAG: hypothetical protein M1834_008280 [Cirrosporium novae-zelandiae]|nr:MAG: hypothetical protein M1834_008280 [Cirrosporium novae-zelandiae]
MTSYGLLEQVEEDALHRPRLLNVEQKPFQRITKRLLTPDSLIASPLTHLATPPPDSSDINDVAAVLQAERQKQTEERQQFREDVLLDFAAFESSIIRIQFLISSNEKERERYAQEKLKIQETAQAVRDNSAELRDQLAEAQKTLALRKSYDALTEKITKDKNLKSRDEQKANIEKLNSEIVELERESRDYAATWAERRVQFGKIVDQGMQMRRLIRDEKEEVERREGMEDDIEDGETASHRGGISTVGTPRLEGETTPMHPGHEAGDSGRLGVDKHHSRHYSPPRSSRAPTPRSERKGSEDSSMTEEGEMRPEPETSKSEIENGQLHDIMMIEEGERIATNQEDMIIEDKDKMEGVRIGRTGPHQDHMDIT